MFWHVRHLGAQSFGVAKGALKLERGHGRPVIKLVQGGAGSKGALATRCHDFLECAVSFVVGHGGKLVGRLINVVGRIQNIIQV